MPAMPANIDAQFFEDKRGSIYWTYPFIHKPQYEEEPKIEAWKQEYEKSERYNPNIKDLIYTTPRVKYGISFKEIKKELNKTHSKQELFKEICSFKSLSNNWDGYGAVPLEVESAGNAIFLISCLSNYIVEAIDQIFPNPNGTISVIWSNFNDEKVSLEIGNNTMSYYCDISEKETKYFDNIEINDSEISKLAIFVSMVI